MKAISIAEGYLMNKWRKELKALVQEESDYRLSVTKKTDAFIAAVYPKRAKKTEEILNNNVEKLVRTKLLLSRAFSENNKKNHEKLFYAMAMWAEVVRGFVDVLEHFALKEEIVFNWISYWRKVVADKEQDMDDRKMAQKCADWPLKLMKQKPIVPGKVRYGAFRLLQELPMLLYRLMVPNS